MVGLPDDEKRLRIGPICNRLDRMPACVRGTDGRTSCHGIVSAMHMRRAVKIIIITVLMSSQLKY